jgi:hypothetical protein
MNLTKDHPEIGIHDMRQLSSWLLEQIKMQENPSYLE